LNLDNALPRFLPVIRSNVRKLLAGAFAASGLAALILGTAFVLIAPAVSDEFDFFRSGLIAPGFVLALIVWGWFTLQDSALVGLRRASWVPIENFTFGFLKLAALPLLGAAAVTNGIFLAWVIPVLPLLIPICFAIFTRVAPAHAELPPPKTSVVHGMRPRDLIFFQAQDYSASILARATTTFLPLLVVGILGASQNAYFFIPFTMVIAFDLLFNGAAMSLVVEGSHDEGRAHDLAHTVVTRFALPLGAASLALALLAYFVLLPFGHAYAANGDAVLRILALGSLFRMIVALFVALERVAGRGRRILAVEASLMLILAPLAAVLASPWGIEGVAAAWTIANAIVALTLLPSLYRRIRPAQALAA
jgi:O-antigen/teichoic acid export membrane protein